MKEDDKQLSLLDMPIDAAAMARRKERVIRDSFDMPGSLRRDIGFVSSSLLAFLPYRDPDPTNTSRMWVRQTRNAKLILKPGERSGYDLSERIQAKSTPEDQGTHLGYPFGGIPRVVLAWVITQAIQEQSPVINLGSSFAAFMRSVGFDNKSGGKNGSFTRVKDQTLRLLASHIELHPIRDVNPKGPVPIHESLSFSFTNQRLFHAGKFASDYINLSSDLYNDLLHHACPVDMAAISNLRQSPMALDLYMWATWRFFSLHDVVEIPWESLMMQFGQEFGHIKKFREVFRVNLAKVKYEYPEARMMDGPKGLRMLPSPTHIPRKLARAA